MEATADIGVIGLAVMGRNLIMNMNDHGFTVAAHNRTTERVDEFLAGEAAGSNVVGVHTLEELVGVLKPPRRVMLMIKAGDPVDKTIESLLPLLKPGDIIIDGGNSLFTDTMKRTARVEKAGMRYIGTGVSGGEEGARYGPSIMPGGTESAWEHVRSIFQGISAKVDDTPCCDWVGADGAGHYVKMVHNGIEYGDMQIIAEAYDMMRRGLGMSHDEMHEVFAEWNRGKLDSYLIEITADIMAVKDESGGPLLDKILDAAGQKGTGKWTVISSMELGQPVTLVGEAVYARIVSALKDQRVTAAGILSGPPTAIDGNRKDILADLGDALYASKIVSYAQGFMLMDEAADEHGWELDFAGIASMWRGGCIIRSRFLSDIMEAYQASPELRQLLLNDFFAAEVTAAQAGWRRTVARAIAAGIPTPAYSSALAFFDGYRTERLPASLIQAQRDYFGAHTYERVDRERGEFFHTNWTGTGGDVSSTSYEV
ncbi:MAG: decarboxylating NADP(+)-dependent phosphogluconate dehydrogenase [Acidimicrobiia bacterium]|nr:decarboxylating NADP(+)-dependent phosphogluconate dehydrogenase [Acidimicrobiia bacterium]NNL28103.1 decarboxylating NADP(+)-dependent phosphogluconate dehydrogenase [Acidimicrobiia bacterium]